jgi:hypothetical protein
LTAINQHNRRLTSTVEALLTPDSRALLNTLLRQESADEAAAGSNAAYKLTLMKKLSQSTKPANFLSSKIELIKRHSFRRAFAKRRCLIPADGFYKWRKTASPGCRSLSP